MDHEFEAMKKKIEDRTNAMTASLAVDSIPDIEMSRQSVAVPAAVYTPLQQGRSLRDVMSKDPRNGLADRISNMSFQKI